MTLPAIDVCAAVVFQRQRFLLATRPAGTHLAGHWEFPGGKVHPGETLEACIVRELHEELGVRAESAGRVLLVEHEYPGKRIRLHFMACRLPDGEAPQPREGQRAAWFSRGELAALDLAPADRRFVEWLQSRDDETFFPTADGC